MGYLLIDHKGGLAPDGSKGERLEFDTVSCCHCQKVIKIVIAGVTKAYETKFRCDRCKRPVCRFCGTVLAGVCSPVAAKIEDAVKRGGWNPWHVYEYKILPHR